MTISLEEWKEKKTKSKDEGFTLTIANAVSKYLNALIDDRPKRRTRWIWELLQNAHDASIASDKRLVASIRDNSEELIFLHNGSGFTIEQIQRLIFHGSTKVEDEETIGRYGSGFLTTHLLSWDIDVSGQLDNDQWFDFRLSRNPESVNALSTSMNQAWDDFNPVTSLREPMPERFTTRFKYPITEIWAKDAVQEGNTTLKQYAPFVVVFNKAFYSIDINEPCEISSFKVVQRCLSIRSGLWEINVIQSINENQTEMKYLLAQEKKASVTVPLRLIGDRLECLSVENIPRLFVAFPLMGTESFSFPAVINGNRKFLKPNENRDGVDLGQGNQLDSDTNRKNQAVIKEACALLTHLFQHAASNGWHHVYRWAEIPAIQEENEWLRECITKNFIESILQSRAILTESGKVIMPGDARLPLAENDENIRELWDLLNDLRGYQEKLPRRDEAIGWCKVIQSWARANECEVLNLPNVGVIDGPKLASHIENRCSHLRDLQNLLQENVCAVDWLNRLYKFLRKDNKIDAVIRGNRLVLNQADEFNPLKCLHRDQDIGEELKDIAELLGWQRIRHQLRDPRLISLDTEQGADDWDSKYIFERLYTQIQKQATRIQEQAKPDPSDDFKEASAQLFAWIVSKKNYSRLGGFPAFAADGKSVLVLPNPGPDSNPPLAPVPAWSEGLEEFDDLFPENRILANDFFKEEYPPEVWEQLDEQGCIRWNMIIPSNKTDLKLLSPEVYGDDKDHETDETIAGATDFAERVAIMDRVRNKRERGYLFWRFLTEWLIKADDQYLEVRTAKCNSCEDNISHEYHMAAWLEPVRNNLWIHNDKDKRRFNPNVQELARLLRDNGWKINSLDENPDIVKLLKAIGVTPSDLRLKFVADDEEKRDEVINLATTLYDRPQLVSHIQANENLPQNLEKILEATEGDLSQVVKDAEERKEQQDRVAENRDFGKRVENWVKQILEQKLSPKGFSVTPKHTGSDLEISEETFDISTQEIIQNEKTWLVEVKGTRVQNVKLSFEQTKNALDESQEFLLCVVPIPEDTEPKFETVRESMRFIKNIHKKLGSRVVSLCNSIDGQKAVMDNIPDDTAPGINLDFEKGKAGIRVNKSLWEDENIGLPLKKLAENLK